MKLIAILAGALLLPACASLSAGPRLQVQVSEPGPMRGPGPGAYFSVTLNNKGRGVAKRVTVACTYFNEAGASVQTGLVYFYNLAGGRSESIGQAMPITGAVRGDRVVR